MKAAELAFWNQLRLVKPEPYRSLPYLAWIRTWPCMVCGARLTEAAHTGMHARGSKASDFRVVPLCHADHLGPRGLDVLGPEEFERVHNIDLRSTVLLLVEIYLSQGNQL